jgi:hypothetical protein
MLSYYRYAASRLGPLWPVCSLIPHGGKLGALGPATGAIAMVRWTQFSRVYVPPIDQRECVGVIVDAGNRTVFELASSGL